MCLRNIAEKQCLTFLFYLCYCVMRNICEKLVLFPQIRRCFFFFSALYVNYIISFRTFFLSGKKENIEEKLSSEILEQAQMIKSGKRMLSIINQHLYYRMDLWVKMGKR